TVFNSIDTIETSLKSVFRSDAEIVVVDGGSKDGTYEKLIELSKEFNLKVYRLPGSSRGLGRDYALRKCPENSYASFFDLDDEYNEYYHKSIEWGSSLGIQNPLPHLVLREYAIKKGGWRDLNYGEDYELLARLGFKFNLPIPLKNVIVKTKSKREKRYTSSFLKYTLRIIKSGIDDYRGIGYKIDERIKSEFSKSNFLFNYSLSFILLEAMIGNIIGTYRVSKYLNNVELADLLRAYKSIGLETIGISKSLS
ncbi:MAG: glycosyltransferase, partial [Thermoplasmata archaeon]